MDDPNVLFYTLWLLILVMIIFFVVMGLILYYKLSKTINTFGYKTTQSQKSLAHWQYANRLAGQVLIIYSFVAFDIAFIVFIIQMLTPKPHSLIIPIIMLIAITILVAILIPITEKKIASNKKLNEE